MHPRADTPEDWAALHLDVLGTPVAVRAPAPVLTPIARQWARCSTRRLPEHELAVASWLEAAERESALASGLTLLGLQGVHGRLNLHAAGLADPDGHVLGLVAASGTGKTTAAQHLGTRWGYVSDECLSIDPDTRDVLPYPKPLALCTDGAGTAKRVVGPDELGLQEPRGQLRLAGLVLLDRRTTRTPCLRPLGVTEAVSALVPQTSTLLELPHPLAALARACPRGTVWQLTYQDIGGAEALLAPLLGDRPRSPRPAGFVHLAAPPTPPGRRGPRRAPWRDAIADADATVVMVGSRSHRLTGTARTVWSALARPADLAALSSLEGGPGPDAVAAALADLAAHELVELT